MKLSSQLLFVLSLALTSNIYASITCSAPKLGKVTGHDSIYHFKTVVTCDLVGEPIDIKSLNDSYRDEITKHGSEFVVHSQRAYDNKKGMIGYALNVTQSYNTPHGHMAVRANIIISSNNTKNFYFELRSKSINAEDDAQYDKTLLNTLTLELLPTASKLTVVKEIDVEEPWYAPDSMFFNKVETELNAAIRKSALLNAKKICGQKVEALSK